MRNRWLVVVVVASLCLNVAVVGSYFFRRACRDNSRRFRSRGLTAEVRQKMRKVREAAMPDFTALLVLAESTDSLLWAEMRRENPDSVRVDSLGRELGRIHGQMRVMVFWQMHRELQLMPTSARTEYLNHMMAMRLGFGRLGQIMGRRTRRGPLAPAHGEGVPPPGPPPGSGD